MAISNGNPVVVLPGEDGLPVAMGSPSAISLGDPVMVIPGEDGLPTALRVSAPANGDPTFTIIGADGLPVTLTFGGQCWEALANGTHNRTAAITGRYVLAQVNDFVTGVTITVNVNSSPVFSETQDIFCKYFDVTEGDSIEIIISGASIEGVRYSPASCVRFLWRANYNCETDTFTFEPADLSDTGNPYNAVYPDGALWSQEAGASSWWNLGVFGWEQWTTSYPAGNVFWQIATPGDQPSAPATPTVYYTWEIAYFCEYSGSESEGGFGWDFEVTYVSCGYTGPSSDWTHHETQYYRKVTTSSTPPAVPTFTPTCGYYWDTYYDCSSPGWDAPYNYAYEPELDTAGWTVVDQGGGLYYAWCITNDWETPPADPPTPSCI